MDAGRTFLRGPGQPAIGRRNDATISTHCPAVHGTVGRESYRVEMIFGWGADFSPSLASIFRKHHCTARADNSSPPGILYEESIETCDQTRMLALPLKAAVAGVQNHSVGADRPTVALVGGETNRADRVALWSRVLPFPPPVDCLSKGGCGADNCYESHHGHQTGGEWKTPCNVAAAPRGTVMPQPRRPEKARPELTN